MIATSHGRTELKRVLGIFDLVTMGVGCIVGAGVFVLTGEVAHEHSGPAILVSYALAALAALFSALCYAEFAADVPVSGAAYNYVDMVFGEFLSWMVASSLLMEYMLSVSTVAKGFSGYFATLVGIDSDALVFTFESTDEVVIDIAGAVIVMLLTALLAYGVRESFTFNCYATLLTVLTVVFTICAAAPNIETDNYTPFFPEELGTVNAFRGASIVFFSYIGFDALATVAEESKNPSRDLPLSIVLSLGICTTLYMLMAASIVGMIPYQDIDIRAAYSVGFKDVGWDWASRIVSFGALCGIVTSMFSCACALFRLLMVFGREGFLPKFLAYVHERTATPLNATILGGTICTLLTLLLDIGTLSSLVSMGTLFAFCLVCLGSIWRRYCVTHERLQSAGVVPVDPKWIAMRLAILICISIVEGIAVDKELPLWTWLVSIICFGAVVLSFIGLPVVFSSKKFSLPFQPLVSCLGVLFTIHLIVTLGITAYLRFVVWQAIAIVIYFVYSVHHTNEETEPRLPLLLESESTNGACNE